MSVNRIKGTVEFITWLGPVLDALRAMGGSARPKEVSDWIADVLKLPNSVTEVTLKSGANRFHNQVQWARQYLVWEGLLDDSRRGVWSLTEKGWQAELDAERSRALFLQRTTVLRPGSASEEQLSVKRRDEPLADDERRELTLLGVLRSLPSYGFELICERLLREHGFEDVSVTSRSRDGGIDGFGTLRLSPFVSMKVAFQSKRYKGNVGRPEVGQFRNDFMGKAEKGVLLTTGGFTMDARTEAVGPGKVPIELIDGERLVELFEEKQLGVRAKMQYDVDFPFFDQFRVDKK